MMVLDENQKIFKIFFGNSYFFNLIFSAPMMYIAIFSIAYMIENISDMTKLTSAMYVVAAMSLHYSIYWAFVAQKNNYGDLMDELQLIVDKSITIFYLNSNFLCHKLNNFF